MEIEISGKLIVHENGDISFRVGEETFVILYCNEGKYDLANDFVHGVEYVRRIFIDNLKEYIKLIKIGGEEK